VEVKTYEEDEDVLFKMRGVILLVIVISVSVVPSTQNQIPLEALRANYNGRYF
jgi:hypothetical protein